MILLTELGPMVYLYLCICVFVYLCICVFVYLCICVFVFAGIGTGSGVFKGC